MQIKTTLRFHLTSTRMGKIKNSDDRDADEDAEEKEHFFTDGGVVNWYNHSGNQSGGSSEKWI